MSSNRFWVFVAAALCVAGIMLLWSYGRAQVLSESQRYAAVSPVLNADQPHLIMSDASGFLDVAQEQPASKLSEFWIGIDGSPADDVLRAQLELPADQGLIVNQVVAGSPADRAGLKQYDVLVIADDKPITQIGELAEYIQQKKETAIVLKLVRAGKPMTIEVSPQRRPASQTGVTCPQVSPLGDAEFARRIYLDVLASLPPAEELASFLNDTRKDKRERLANDLLRRSTVAEKSCLACHTGSPSLLDQIVSQQLLRLNLVDADRDGFHDLYVAGAPLGVAVYDPQALPDDVTLTITRQGENPARIQVSRGDQSWGTTESKLDELPEDIRDYVRPFIAPGSTARLQAVLSYRDLSGAHISLEPHRLLSPQELPETQAGVGPSGDSAKPGTSESQRIEDQLKNLTRELEQLRKTVETLRASPKPPSDPAGESSK